MSILNPHQSLVPTSSLNGTKTPKYVQIDAESRVLNNQAQTANFSNKHVRSINSVH